MINSLYIYLVLVSRLVLGFTVILKQLKKKFPVVMNLQDLTPFHRILL